MDVQGLMAHGVISDQLLSQGRFPMWAGLVFPNSMVKERECSVVKMT